MTDFDKVVIPLIDEDILPSDLDEQFVGCFTEDLDQDVYKRQVQFGNGPR